MNSNGPRSAYEELDINPARAVVSAISDAVGLRQDAKTHIANAAARIVDLVGEPGNMRAVQVSPNFIKALGTFQGAFSGGVEPVMIQAPNSAMVASLDAHRPGRKSMGPVDTKLTLG